MTVRAKAVKWLLKSYGNVFDKFATRAILAAYRAGHLHAARKRAKREGER